MEEFIKRLSIETPFSYSDSKYLTELINDKVGSIETAKKIYEIDGFNALIVYYKQLELGILY